jgi:hypothetical protein
MFYIIDYNASLVHTHHNGLIKSFADLLDNQNEEYEIFLPIGSRLDFSKIKGQMNYCLIPGGQTVEFEFKKLSSWFNSLIGKFYNSIPVEIRFFSFAWNKFLLILQSIVIGHSLRVVSKRIQATNNDNVKLLFPTACPVSFALARKLEKKEFNCTCYFRLTNTGENRGIFQKLNDKYQFFEETESYQFVNCKFGFEMEDYAHTFPLKSEFNHSPFPPRSHSQIQKSTQNIACFLGMAQKHKGQDDLFEIVVETLKLSDSGVSWVVQANESTQDIFHSINTNGSRLKVETGFMSDEKMFDYLTQASLACLPYNIDYYQYNSSAFAYLCADYSVAVATFFGSAFAKEIHRFGIGIIARTPNEMSHKISEFFALKNDSFMYNINEYNLYRKKSNLIFLDLLNVTNRLS